MATATKKNSASTKKSSAKKPSASRGSAKLNADALLKPQKISKSELNAVLKIIRVPGAELRRWECYGQPAIDRVVGSIGAKPELAGKLVAELLKVNAQSLGVHVLINGMPPIERFAEIQLNMGRRR